MFAGRHSFNGAAMRGPLVIDLRNLNEVHVDAESRTAWVGGGTLTVDVDKEAIEYNLAAVGGQYYTTGEHSALVARL
jgi:FAD/FMN-containing dehydrogenase